MSKKNGTPAAPQMPFIPANLPTLHLEKPGAQRIAIPPALRDILAQRRAAAEAKIEAARAEFERDSGLLLTGFLNGCPDVDANATYEPTADFTHIVKK